MKTKLDMKTKLLTEGGGAIPGCTPLNNRNVPQTLDYLMRQLLHKFPKLSENDLFPIGSTLKKIHPLSTVGDIDLGFIHKKYSPENVLETIQKTFPSAKHMKGINVISFPFEITLRFPDDYQNSIHFDQIPIVQVDLMLSTNRKWTEFAYLSPLEGTSKYSSKYAKKLFTAVVGVVGREILETARDSTGKEIPVIYEKYLFHNKDGLLKVTQTHRGQFHKDTITKGKRTLERKLITQDPQDLPNLLFGHEFPIMELDTFEKVRDAICASPTISTKERQEIFHNFALDIIDLKE